MTGNIISLKAFISRLIIDFGLENKELSIYHVKQWVVSCISQVGAYDLWAKREAELTVDEYSAYLPDDFVYVDELLFNKQFSINAGKIYFPTTETGTITLKYLGALMDCDGNIYIPEEESLITACQYKILYHLALRGEYTIMKYEDLFNLYQQYILDARATINTRSLQVYNKIATEHNNFKPTLSHFSTMFENYGNSFNMFKNGNN